jgi:putative chitinase
MSIDLLPHLQKLWPHGDQHVPGLIEGIATSAPAVFEKHKIETPLTIAIMMAQFSEECGAGLEMEENMNYTAERLLQVFPRHFTPRLAAQAAHNPRMVADIAYGGRMGNAPPPSDDGYNFRGRGLSQVTGRDGYAALAKATGLDLTDNPSLLSSPDYALECGVADFVLCGCLPFAEKGDVLSVTKHLNGGTNGLAERVRWTGLWKRELGA